jgi:hypothetical protein
VLGEERGRQSRAQRAGRGSTPRRAKTIEEIARAVDLNKEADKNLTPLLHLFLTESIQ